MQPVMVIGYHKSVCNVRPDNIRLSKHLFKIQHICMSWDALGMTRPTKGLNHSKETK